ncbi:MAG: general secretion pathway protein G [Kiritimatiellia bacterium]
MNVQAAGAVERKEHMNKQQKKMSLARGFTLVEVLLVIVIIGILAAIAVPNFAGKTDKARVASAKSQIKNLASAVDIFEVDTGTYPSTLQGLITNPGVNSWDGPYMKGNSIPNDPWGVPYQYSSSGNGYDIKSPGPAGKNTPISLND